MITVVVVASTFMAASGIAAAGGPHAGVEIGARTGYAFSAGNTGAVPNGNDNSLGDFVGGQLPLWLDAGYRLNPSFYVGGFFQYGFGFVNDDQQQGCRNANVNCSASDIRLGLMGRYHPAPTWLFSPWLGLGAGYEWGTFSVRQSVLGNTSTDSSWSGFEFANLQAGADYQVSRLFALAPFISFSIGQFRSTSVTTSNGTTTTTTDQDLAKTSFHEWFLIGARVAFMP
jgi:hypothetical protein